MRTSFNNLKWIKSQFLQLKTGNKKTQIHKVKKIFNLLIILFLIFIYLPFS